MPEKGVALITGGNRGIGYETARRLKEARHTVYVGARNEERGRKAADELDVGFVRLDVTGEGSVTEAAAELEQLEGRIDVLVNNAGIREPNVPTGDDGNPQPFKEAHDLTGADAMEVFDTNVFGIIRIVHAFLTLLGESQVSVPLYSASKAAVTMLTVQYAKLLPGMCVNAADPGLTATDFTGGQGHSVQDGPGRRRRHRRACQRRCGRIHRYFTHRYFH